MRISKFRLVKYILLTLSSVLTSLLLSNSCLAASPNPWIEEACKLLDEDQQYARNYQVDKEHNGHIIDSYLSLDVHHCLENIPPGEARTEIIEAADDYIYAGYVAEYAGNPLYRSGYDIHPPARVFNVFSKFRIRQETAYDGKPGITPQDLYDVDEKGHLTDKGLALTQKVLNIIWNSATVHTTNARILGGIKTVPVDISTYARFLEAIDHNDVRNLKIWLQKGVNLDKPDLHGQTPIARALLAGRLEVVNQLLQAGVTFSSKEATDALISTAGTGYNNIIKLLILKGADVNAKSGFLGTPILVLATQSNQIESVRLFLAAGAAVNATNDLKETSLWWAANYDLPEIVKVLLSHNADTNIKNRDDKTASMVAEEKSFDDIIELLQSSPTNNVGK